MIGYLRDTGLDYNFCAESFETCVPWDKVDVLVKNTKKQIKKSCQ